MRSHYSLASISSGRTAASLSPRYKYAYLQEMIGDILATRTVFERFEIRCQEYERARAIFRYGLKQTKQHDTL